MAGREQEPPKLDPVKRESFRAARDTAVVLPMEMSKAPNASDANAQAQTISQQIAQSQASGKPAGDGQPITNVQDQLPALSINGLEKNKTAKGNDDLEHEHDSTQHRRAVAAAEKKDEASATVAAPKDRPAPASYALPSADNKEQNAVSVQSMPSAKDKPLSHELRSQRTAAENEGNVAMKSVEPGQKLFAMTDDRVTASPKADSVTPLPDDVSVTPPTKQGFAHRESAAPANSTDVGANIPKKAAPESEHISYKEEGARGSAWQNPNGNSSESAGEKPVRLLAGIAVREDLQQPSLNATTANPTVHAESCRVPASCDQHQDERNIQSYGPSAKLADQNARSQYSEPYRESVVARPEPRKQSEDAFGKAIHEQNVSSDNATATGVSSDASAKQALRRLEEFVREGREQAPRIDNQDSASKTLVCGAGKDSSVTPSSKDEIAPHDSRETKQQSDNNSATTTGQKSAQSKHADGDDSAKKPIPPSDKWESSTGKNGETPSKRGDLPGSKQTKSDESTTFVEATKSGKRLDVLFDQLIERINRSPYVHSGRLADPLTRRLLLEVILNLENGRYPSDRFRDEQQVLRAVRELGTENLRELRNILSEKPHTPNLYAELDFSKKRQFARFVEITLRNLDGKSVTQKTRQPRNFTADGNSSILRGCEINVVLTRIKDLLKGMTCDVQGGQQLTTSAEPFQNAMKSAQSNECNGGDRNDAVSNLLDGYSKITLRCKTCGASHSALAACVAGYADVGPEQRSEPAALVRGLPRAPRMMADSKPFTLGLVTLRHHP